MINPNLAEARLGGEVIFSGSYDLQNNTSGSGGGVEVRNGGTFLNNLDSGTAANWGQ